MIVPPNLVPTSDPGPHLGFKSDPQRWAYCVPDPSGATSQPRNKHNKLTTQDIAFGNVIITFSSNSCHPACWHTSSCLWSQRLLFLGPWNLSLGTFSLATLQSPLRPRKLPSLCFCLTLALWGFQGWALATFLVVATVLCRWLAGDFQAERNIAPGTVFP